MIGSGAVAWLDLWERAAPKPPRLRRRELLAASLDDASAAGDLEIGQANAALLRLHCAMFGPRLACHTACPACGAALELDLDAEDLLARAPHQRSQEMEVQAGPWEIAFRLPTEGDLDAVEREIDPAGARDGLLRRCVSRCRCEGAPSDISLAPPGVIALVSARMEERDPLATLDFDLRCAACDHPWSSNLRVDAFLFARLGAWAQRLLREVHTLAGAYGWDERTITEMSAMKRRLYLDMVEECASS